MLSFAPPSSRRTKGNKNRLTPGLWGKRLAEYLREKLPGQGIETGEIYSEDWGWAVPVKNETFALWIGCGHQDGDDDEFLCFIEPSKPIIRRFFKKIDTTDAVAQLAKALEAILTSDPDIRDLRWSSDGVRGE